jgi:hypothetical protein
VGAALEESEIKNSVRGLMVRIRTALIKQRSGKEIFYSGVRGLIVRIRTALIFFTLSNQCPLVS